MKTDRRKHEVQSHKRGARLSPPLLAPCWSGAWLAVRQFAAARPRRPSRVPASRHSCSVTRTSPRSTSSATCTSRRSQAQGYTVNAEAEHRLDRGRLEGAEVGSDPGLPGVRRHAAGDGRRNHQEPDQARPPPPARRSNWAAKHGYPFTNVTPFSDSDAIAVLKSHTPRRTVSRRSATSRSSARPSSSAAPPSSRPAIPDGLLGLNRIYGVHPTFVPLTISSFYTRSGQRAGQRGSRVHHRPAARRQASTSSSRTRSSSSGSRTSAWSSRQSVAKAGGLRVHQRRQQGQRAADAEGDHRAELGGRGQQAVGGVGRQGVPEGQSPAVATRLHWAEADGLSLLGAHGCTPPDRDR